LAFGSWLLALGFGLLAFGSFASALGNCRLPITPLAIGKENQPRINANHVFSVSDSCLFAKFAAKLLSYLRFSAEIAYHRKSATLFLWLLAEC